MITTAANYDYPPNGRYNETVATLEDGRVMTVNTQYAQVLPRGEHAEDCDQINKIGGVCGCGLLDGVDVDALVADARERGLRGQPERETPRAEPTDEEWTSPRGLTLTEEMDSEDTVY